MRTRLRAPVIRMARLVLLGFASLGVQAQTPSTRPRDSIVVQGTVLNSTGQPIPEAHVQLVGVGRSIPASAAARTDAKGAFVLSASTPGAYSVRAEKSGWRIRVSAPLDLAAGDKKRLDLVLEALSPDSAGAMEFADKPNFTVAGVTDYNNMGTHGSGMSVRTSDSLTQETLALKSDKGESTGGKGIQSSESEKRLRAALIQSPKSFEANHQLGEFYCLSGRYTEAIPFLESANQIQPNDHGNVYSLALAYRGSGDLQPSREQVRKLLAIADMADAHRLLGDLDERLGDPLEAVREYEKAARLDPSEQNYFEWGAELLLHRADLAAVEVFTKGAGAHPDSARMLAGLGAALYAAGSYEEAARRLCAASDLRPQDPTPYLFLGKIQTTAPEPLACIEEKLSRFVHDQPGNALANYYYAIALWKRDQRSGSLTGQPQTQASLEKAISLDPKLGAAYLQLGITYAGQGSFQPAIGAYQKAIEVSPQLGEAHYRLAAAYRRTGDEAKAMQEMRLYEQVEKAEAATRDRHKQEVQQFLIVLKDQVPPTTP